MKDAFLQVPQRNRTACELPKEYVELFCDEDPQSRNDGFLLLRVLPGQRDAACFGVITLRTPSKNSSLVGVLRALLFFVIPGTAVWLFMSMTYKRQERVNISNQF